MSAKTWICVSLLACVCLVSALLVACGNTGNVSSSSTGGNQGGGSPGGSNGQAAISVTLSDPTVCSASQGGPFQHIYVTITDVQIFPSASPPLQNGVDLTPGLNQSPAQVDLLGTPGPNCALAVLGSSALVPPGKYHALQVSLAAVDQIASIKGGSKCPNTPSGPAASCAVLADGTAVDLDQASTGSFQFNAIITAGEIDLSAGAQVLNLDFDSCASMVFIYAGDYGMDPTVHAALMATAGTITGRLLDSDTQQPIVGDVIVALEQPDSNGVDREIMQAAPAPDGSFVLCPVAPGTYDVVATAVSTTGVSYLATVTSGVQPGNALGNVPLQATAGTKQTAAILTGQVTATGPVPPLGGYTHLVISALQSISLGGATRLVTVPLPTQYASTLRTFVTGSTTFELYVSPGNPLVGAFSPTGTKYKQGTTGAATYNVDTQSSCNPSTVRSTAVSVSPGGSSSVPAFALQGCPPA